MATNSKLRNLLSRAREVLHPTGEAVSKIPCLDLLAYNWNLGFTCFGGPSVHFQIFRELFVNKYAWLNGTTYDDLFALCQAFSGPASTKMLYAINVIHYGLWGGIVAFFVWSLPMAIAAWGLALGVGRIGDELPGPVYAVLSGLNSATVGIIALAAVQLSHGAITDTLSRILVLLGATAGMLYNAIWYFPVLMAAGGLAAVAWDQRIMAKVWRSIFKRTSNNPPSDTADLDAAALAEDRHLEQSSDRSLRSRATRRPSNVTAPAFINNGGQTVSEEEISTSSWKSGLVIMSAFFGSFLIIMVCRAIYSGQNRSFDLFANLYLAGTIIFGGGPVVIPLLREYTVTPGWIPSRDFLLGLAITQAFPGPNFNFAVYLGALAVQGTQTPLTAGAIIAFVGIFTPGLWLVTGGLGLWESMRKRRAVRSCLRGIHASAVGLVFTAVYRLFQIGYLDSEARNGGSLGREPWWVVIVATAFVGGMHFKVPPIAAIVLGAVMGLIWYARKGTT